MHKNHHINSILYVNFFKQIVIITNPFHLYFINFFYIQTKPERQVRSDVNDGILFYTPFTHEKNTCISTSGSMIYHLFICCTVSEQNPHVITAGIDNTVNINFASVSTVKANVIVTYNKTIITLYIRNRR